MGFTGTREGMTDSQKLMVESIIDWLRPQELHHGDCIGSDREAHYIARKHEYIWLIGHPPTDETYRAFLEFDQIRVPQEYLVRDKRIVIESNILVATPKNAFEELRSGTWATIRYGLAANMPVLIVPPNGSILVKNLFGLGGTLTKAMNPPLESYPSG